MSDGHGLEQFFNALVDVEHPQLQVEHRFARHAEKKMARLDDARVDRADRHLEHAFAFDRAEFVAHAAEGRQLGARVEVLAQRPNVRPVVVQDAAGRVGMADELDAEQILDLALLPVDGVNGVGQRRQLRFVRRDGNADQNESVGGVQDVEIIDEEDIFPGAGVLGEEAGEAGAVLFVKRGAKGGGQFEFGVQVKLVGAGRARLLDLRAEPVRQFVKHNLQAGQQIHGALRPAGARTGEKIKMRFHINPPID